ncbi:LADA_0E07712g1_1 [Lachancea dasiensis]|uniref:LADA_0E07712g1_1 n=1 Tax=Lachancea dasiensis TaxID=1072105 RepID=A0A1G4JD70_9SACH|nr:LADA_0E07712g1_1 [Lachancea dasiensis]
MNISAAISSFKDRIDALSSDWERLSRTCSSSADEEMKLLKQKLDLVQEQNSSLIIELYDLKKLTNLMDDKSSNIFSSVTDTSVGALHLQSGGDEQFVLTPQGATTKPLDLLPSLSSQKLPRPESMVGRHVTINHENSPTNQYPFSFNVHAYFNANFSPSPWARKEPSASPKHSLKRFKKSAQIDDVSDRPVERRTNLLVVESPSGKPMVRRQAKSTIESFKKIKRAGSSKAVSPKPFGDFKLRMTATPKGVTELYHEYEQVLRPQIVEFERNFGKGQLSKLYKVRTYQRRRALVCEINNYAAKYDITIDEAISYFETIRVRNGKTVAWLYNNLNKIIEFYG